jgi:hypothetical protein
VKRELASLASLRISEGDTWADLQGFGNEDFGILFFLSPQLRPDSSQPQVLVPRVLQATLQSQGASEDRPVPC